MAITRVSTAADGTQGDGGSGSPVFSPDGTKIAFGSTATNLVAGDTNGAADVFVKDLTTGALTRLSTSADGTQGNGSSGSPVFSLDGTKVVFTSSASNLISGDTNNVDDIFVKDLVSGTVTRVSTAADGTQANSFSSSPAFSPDGTKVAFESNASNLVPGDTNYSYDIFVKDLVSGAVTRASTATDGSEAKGGPSFGPIFSPDGTKVGFESISPTLVAGANEGEFLKNLNTGALTLVSAAADGTPGNSTGGSSPSLSFSPDGTKVAFASSASNLVTGDTNNSSDIFVKDLATGAVTRISTAADGKQGNLESYGPVFSPDGTKVAFGSIAPNLVTGDTNNREDVFVKDLGTGAITRIPTAADGTQGNDSSFTQVFSPDGTKVAFTSYASNLVPNDTNGTGDVFVADVSLPCYCPGTLILTDRGEVAVEDLAIGDRLVTLAGVARAIKWIGRRSYAGRFLAGKRDLLPVCFAAGSLGDQLPRRDLYVSPLHAMYLDGVLVPARRLVNGATIRQTEDVREVHYIHVELDSHDVIFAEGTASESFVDDDSRGMFHNAHDYRALYPQARRVEARYCAPRVESGHRVEAIRRRLALRAGLECPGEAWGELRGSLDEVAGDTVRGWAQGLAHPDAPVFLEVTIDGQAVGAALADTYRPDLVAAGIGSGRHAYEIRLTGAVAPGSLVEVRRAGDGALLGRVRTPVAEQAA